MSRSIVVRMIRHGQSDWNAARRVQGHNPEAGPLTALGRAQVRATTELLAGIGSRATLVVSSDLLRARDSALVVAGGLGLPIRYDAELRELNMGALEGRCLDDPLGGGTVEDAVARLWSQPRRPAPGGESVLSLHRRIHAALARLASEASGDELIVITHGGPVRVAAVERVDDVRHSTVGNASLTTLRVAVPEVPAWSLARAS